MKFYLATIFTIGFLLLLLPSDSDCILAAIGKLIGRGVGGSGKPLQHFILKPNRKAAEDAARRQGGGRPPIHHNEAGRRSHYHPSDTNGNIRKDGSHFQYGKPKNRG